MQALDYHIPCARSVPALALAWLIALPTACTALAGFSALHWMGNPFMIVRVRDVALFGGEPIALIISGVAWHTIARRHKVPGLLRALVLAWFFVLLFASVDTLVWYLHEPWIASGRRG